MSHSKMNKHGNSLYLEKWNPAAKKYINVCTVCGAKGYRPAIEDEGFTENPPKKTSTFERRAIYAELTATLKPLPLDDMGRCSVCAKHVDR